MAQQLRTLVPPLGRAVKAESVRVSSSVSRSSPGGEARLDKFNFGVDTGEMNLVEMEVWSRLDCCLIRMWVLHRKCD